VTPAWVVSYWHGSSAVFSSAIGAVEERQQVDAADYTGGRRLCSGRHHQITLPLSPSLADPRVSQGCQTLESGRIDFGRCTCMFFIMYGLSWSGRGDLNSGPPEPHLLYSVVSRCGNAKRAALKSRHETRGRSRFRIAASDQNLNTKRALLCKGGQDGTRRLRWAARTYEQLVTGEPT